MRDKYLKAIEVIESGMAQFPHSVVLWSGGKDSMVLLHLMRDCGFELPVVFFREPWQPHKYAFQDHIIREWELLAYTWHPYQSAMQEKDGEYEVQNWYKLNNMTLTCPSGIVPPDSDYPWACAIDMLNRPKQPYLQVHEVNAAWVGHERCDSDPVLGGDAGTRVHGRINPDHVSMFFPLRDWSHEEIWQYIEENDVPYDKARYTKVGPQWIERPNQRYNADYVHACTACLDRQANEKVVHCPKLGFEIELNIEKVPWVEPELLSYMKD